MRVARGHCGGGDVVRATHGGVHGFLAHGRVRRRRISRSLRRSGGLLRARLGVRVYLIRRRSRRLRRRDSRLRLRHVRLELCNLRRGLFVSRLDGGETSLVTRGVAVGGHFVRLGGVRGVPRGDVEGFGSVAHGIRRRFGGGCFRRASGVDGGGRLGSFANRGVVRGLGVLGRLTRGRVLHGRGDARGIRLVAER